MLLISYDLNSPGQDYQALNQCNSAFGGSSEVFVFCLGGENQFYSKPGK